MIFRLGTTYGNYLRSLGIRLSGELGELASADSRYRELGVRVIAKKLDPGYKGYSPEVRTPEELLSNLKNKKMELLTHCEGILLGDV